MRWFAGDVVPSNGLGGHSERLVMRKALCTGLALVFAVATVAAPAMAGGYNNYGKQHGEYGGYGRYGNHDKDYGRYGDKDYDRYGKHDRDYGRYGDKDYGRHGDKDYGRYGKNDRDYGRYGDKDYGHGKVRVAE
jgi:hypothetical protein